MRTTTFVIALMVVLAVQIALLLRPNNPPAALPVAALAPELPVMAEVRIIDAEKRLAQVETQLSELRELLKGNPLVRRLGGRDEAAKNHSSAPVNYGGWVAILSAPEAAAVVQFTAAPHGEAGASYHYRSVRARQAAEESGEGKVFEKYRSVPGQKPGDTFLIDEGGQLTVKAGALQVEWSHSSDGSGSVYYDPETMRVYLAARVEYETVDLHHYMR